ncbi:hypothetical protein [Kribbella monticola]|uniref:hypothetical protein n=1 Tax=Kribbella monticola TaxID=2185285 RepID=UPI000DD4C0A6|nr:hypothetical protein [Kribbella monticola]
MSKIVSLSLAAVMTLSLVSCGGDKKSGTPAPSVTPSVSTSSTPVVSSTPTVAPSTSDQPVQRTKAQLTRALLVLADLPSGLSVVPEDPSDAGVKPFSSKDAKCKTLVQYLNADSAPGSTVSVSRSFSAGQEGPDIDYGLDAMGEAKKVAALQSAYRAAVNSCRKVTLKVPGQGTSSMGVEEISAPKLGERPFAFRMTGLSGPQEGSEATAALAGVNDVILSVFIYAGQPGELDGAMKLAVDKAKKVLGTKSGT